LSGFIKRTSMTTLLSPRHCAASGCGWKRRL